MDNWQQNLDTDVFDSTFVWGFVSGFIATVAAAWLFGQFAALWNKVLQPFRPSEKPAEPAKELGPSPAAQFGSWLSSVLLLLIIVVLVGALIWMAAGGSS